MNFLFEFVSKKRILIGEPRLIPRNPVSRGLASVTLLFFTFLFFPSISHANGLLKAPSNLGLVGYWSFNEGTSTTAGDGSGNGNNGALEAFNVPVDSSSTWTNGKFGNALKFDGSDDRIAIANSSSLNMGGRTAFTISAWVKFTAFNTSSSCHVDSIAVKDADANAGSYSLYVVDTGGCGAATGQKHLSLQFNNSSGTAFSVGASGGNLSVGVWYHLMGVYDGSTLKTYVNGVQDDSASVSATVGSNTGIFNIGRNSPNPGGYHYELNGIIDEVRVYNRALSASEIANLYNTKVQSKKTVSNRGLVGYWPMEEGSGSAIGDFSGNKGEGTFNNSLITWKGGKFGSALEFNTLNQVGVSIPNSPSLNPTNAITVSAWIYPTSWPSNNRIIQKGATDNQYRLTAEASALYFGVYIPGIERKVGTNTLPPLNTWTNVVGIYDGANLYIYYNGVLMVSAAQTGTMTSTTDPLVIGCKSASSCATTDGFNGKIDDVRIYNRALSSDEVLALARTGGQVAAARPQTNLVTNGLIGYWPFGGSNINWATGKALDASGSGNDGNMINLATSTAPVQGKVGQALTFNGANSYINVDSNSTLDLTTGMSISAWVNPSVLKDEMILHRNASFTQKFELTANRVGNGFFQVYCSTNVSFYSANSTTLVSASLNTWVHLVGTCDSSGTYIYVNGIQEGSASFSGTLSAQSGNPVQIGAEKTNNTRYFKGSIDEVRLYNRAITPTEVKQLYNAGR